MAYRRTWPLAKQPDTDWDDTPGLPRLVIPVRFRVFPPLFGQKTSKRIGMTRLGDITEQRHFSVFRTSHATRRDAQDLLFNLGYFGGKAQRHNSTKVHTYELSARRMHGWTKA